MSPRVFIPPEGLVLHLILSWAAAMSPHSQHSADVLSFVFRNDILCI